MVVSSSSVLIALVAVLTRLFQSIEWLSGNGRAEDEEEGFLAGEVGLVNLQKKKKIKVIFFSLKFILAKTYKLLLFPDRLEADDPEVLEITVAGLAM